MDVHCSSCGEPWDTYHLLHEAIFETALSAEETEAWRFLRSREKLADRYRQAFRDAGWEFGQTFINVIRCPCCPNDATPNAERARTKAALEELFGNDHDGLAAAFEDFRL
jgi:hypothetical protein